jgi:hypothetical protein
MSDTPISDALEASLHDRLGHGSYEQAMPTMRELEASHERLRVALEYAAYELDAAYCGIKTLPDDHPARLVVNKADAALAAIPEAK